MGIFRRRHRDEVIDLTKIEQALADDSAGSSPDRFEWGLPTPCPECGGHGYLDRIDPVREIMYQHCTTCFLRWEVSRQELETARSTA